MSEKQRTTAEEITDAALENRRMMSHRFFFGYLYDAITHTSIYAHWQHLLAWLRRFRTVAFVLRALTVLFAILETGALVVLSTAVFLVILPLAVALMLGILITAAVESIKSNRILSNRLQNQHVCVLFMPTDASPFFAQHAKSLAKDGYSVIVVSPYLLLSKGVCQTDQKTAFYATFRKETTNLYLIRRYYLFSLRKKVLSKCNTAYLY